MTKTIQQYKDEESQKKKTQLQDVSMIQKRIERQNKISADTLMLQNLPNDLVIKRAMEIVWEKYQERHLEIDSEDGDPLTELLRSLDRIMNHLETIMVLERAERLEWFSKN
jgi:hypothetical protein